MIITLTCNNKTYTTNLEDPIDISLPLREGENNPNCYWADPVKFETIRMGNFVGSVKEGGPVNYQKITLTPHGNGTHTECYGHISADGATINQNLNRFHFVTEVVTIIPEVNAVGDYVITEKILIEKKLMPGTQALVVRTHPNDVVKKAKQYSGTNPPYIEANAIAQLVKHGIQHMLIDLPSLDKEVDGGALAAHKAFWSFPGNTRKNATITELIFVPDEIPDGLYLLNLQIISLETDASPSKPVLYKLREVL
ncbi:MAG: cyclase family protein [Cyclobacteriaceae bacterium]|nr:cyclase family protein [Cyclobacteriaceae bacterium]